NGDKPSDGLYKSRQNKRFEISNGILVNEFYVEEHEQQNGEIIEIDNHRMQQTKKGNRVWLNNKPAPNGEYKIGFFSTVSVLKGLIR
ncbi:MAG: hypothetical protein H7339_17375, partial [Arcicella sp.]|nr:hypothetical protein [Arcicella sp.]